MFNAKSFAQSGIQRQYWCSTSFFFQKFVLNNTFCRHPKTKMLQNCSTKMMLNDILQPLNTKTFTKKWHLIVQSMAQHLWSSNTPRPGTQIDAQSHFNTLKVTLIPLNVVSIDTKWILWFQVSFDLISYSNWYFFQ